jgi:threonine dehydrogenase-like Zn-dependent dehydrogenase
MGHEFTGTIVETGSDVKKFGIGDTIVSPFTISCGDCFYCQHGLSSRCERCLLFGTPLLDGAQSEYVRVPLADSTLEKAPATIDEKKLVLMADIFPTGYFAASNALAGLNPTEVHDSTIVVIGCGPVGLCALINALEYKPKHVLALDSVESRVQLASDLGAEAWNSITDKDALYERIKELTDGRGPDAVIEVVGSSPALRTAFEILRPWGTISSVGVHNAEIPWTGKEAYGKNLKIQMGRCSVRSERDLPVSSYMRLGSLYDRYLPTSTQSTREEPT